MLNTLIKKIFGSRNDRILSQLQHTVDIINKQEPLLAPLSDTALAAKTTEFKARLAKGESLDALLPEAFAVVREVSKRCLGLRHFDVQLMGGIVLHQGKIPEMRTGEGKTLCSTLPVYLNALNGQGVHLITVNDYLAKRDSEWMKPIFEFLGLSVGVILPDMPFADKKLAYRCDIVYGTNNEFGFDYLRDNMAFALEDKVQGPLHFAVIDEVDSILIDEARTPLIISGAAEDSSQMYQTINQLVPLLKAQLTEGDQGHYTIDEKQKQAYLTEEGHLYVEELLVQHQLIEPGESLYHASNIGLMHHVNAALRAHTMYHRDVEYIINQNQVVIVDEHTGRSMPGRRWSDGLHQAIEAKEGVKIQNENQTLASITFQNFFRLYQKLSGMTGTADTEAFEFQQIYHLEVVVIPTNQAMRRDDQSDLVYLSQADKYQAVIEDIKQCISRQQPVLVGTASIESSELLSQMLTKAQIKHQVLNAKFHEKEAQIIAEAGRPGVVTIATNMAGRGTDIVLGGSLAADLAALGDQASDAQIQKTKDQWQQRHDAVISAGGLRIIGSERHESRRIDNQLRGRAGRQGDPGSTRFYLSLDDNLMRIFASDRVASLMRRLGMQPGEPIEHSLVTKAIENAQRKLEGHNFDIRKQLLSYDNVANDQRKVIYAQRASIMEMDDTHIAVESMTIDVLDALISNHIPLQSLEDQWEIAGLSQLLAEEFRIQADIQGWCDDNHQIQAEDIKQKILELFHQTYEHKQSLLGPAMFHSFEKSIILQSLDTHWREHLSTMDQLRQGIHLRGYAQKDPKQEYKRESFELFKNMLESLKYEIVKLISSVEINTDEDLEEVEAQRRAESVKSLKLIHEDIHQVPEDESQTDSINFAETDKKLGRNDPCHCNSGKKYKHCHGRIA